MKNNNEGHFVSKIGNKKEERLELFDKKIKETFERSEDFFKNFRFKEETFKKKMFEGNLSMNEVYKTGELLDITSEELIFIFFGETPEEQRKYLITEEMMKRISRIKFENIFSLLWIPLAIIQILKAREDFIIVAIIMEAMFLFTINYTTREMRKEFKEIAPELDDKIKDTINSIVTILEQIKKETIVKANSIYHKRNASKSLSYSIINQNS